MNFDTKYFILHKKGRLPAFGSILAKSWQISPPGKMLANIPPPKKQIWGASIYIYIHKYMDEYIDEYIKKGLYILYRWIEREMYSFLYFSKSKQKQTYIYIYCIQKYIVLRKCIVVGCPLTPGFLCFEPHNLCLLLNKI